MKGRSKSIANCEASVPFSIGKEIYLLSLSKLQWQIQFIKTSTQLLRISTWLNRLNYSDDKILG